MHEMKQNTPEWLEMRRNKIGASDSPIIMGVSPWTTPLQLWEQKLGLREEKYKTPRMQRGHDLEEKARHQFESMTGLSVFPQVIQHPDYEWMIASLDGIDFCHKNIVEIKCPSREDHLLAFGNMVPNKYKPQLQHQMEVCGLEKVYYFSFDGKEGKIIEVERDDKYIDKMLKKELEFWDCMQNFKTPALTDKDYIQQDNELWEAASNSWLDCHQKLEFLKKQEEELKETLIALSGGSNSKGAGIKLSKVIRKGNVDYNAIPELENVDLEKYRKKHIESWRLVNE